MTKYKQLKPKKTSDLAVEAIWELIHSGELKPGDKLPPERELSERFGISMTSLREALQKLESFGHISKKRGKGGGSIILDISETQGLEIAAKNTILKGVAISQMKQALITILPLFYEMVCDEIKKDQLEILKEISKKHKEEFENHRGSVLGWKFAVESSKILNNPVYTGIVEFIMLLLMNKEFSLGIDDIGTNDKVREYNKAATVYTSEIVTAIENKDKKLIRKAVTKITDMLDDFQSDENEPLG